MIKKHLTGFYTAMLLLSMFTLAYGGATQGFFLSNFIEKYNLTASSQGLPLMLQNAFSVAAIILMMLMAGRIKKHTAVLTALLFSCTAMLGLSLVPPFAVMSLLYGLFGIAMGIQDTAGGALMVDIHPESPVRLNDMHFLFGIGNITAPLVFQFLVSEGVLWNHVFLFVFAVQAVLAAVFLLVVKAGAPGTKSDAETENTGINIKRIAAFLKADGNIFLFFAMFFYCAHQMGIAAWIRRFFEVEMGSGVLGTAALSAFWVGTAISRILLPRLGVRPQKQLAYGSALAAIAMLTGILLKNPFIMVACMAVTGFAGGNTIPHVTYLSCERLKSNTLVATTILFIGMYIGGSMVSPVIGSVSARFSLEIGIFIPAAAAVFVAAAGFGFLAHYKNRTH
ncbi:MFS transporter [Ruminococcus gauvreauii]|uniref:MFS transporter n=1 Tax=Ruminococcus gauvreauii TaxID=438033 RepID=A0ABY5VIG8_9FIRM|nr:MFS transporter [Ruminococcus gauvreauii]UWP59328.1 MFS transporter [Ruminococcus gauvreauii]